MLKKLSRKVFFPHRMGGACRWERRNFLTGKPEEEEAS
jgi:hypothetical protein